MRDVTESDAAAADYVGHFAARVELDPTASCLVLVDLQYGLASRSAGLGRLLVDQGRGESAEYRFARIERLAVPNCARLLAAFRERGLPCVFLVTGSTVPDYSDLPPHLRELCRATNCRVGEHEHGVLAEVRPRPDEPVLNKLGLSAFASTSLETLLRSWGIATVAFAGVTTNMCVEHNVRDAADRGFGCVLVKDACATDSRQMHDGALRNVARLYGRVATTGQVLAELKPESTDPDGVSSPEAVRA